MAGWGGQTDWLRNARACPQVQVKVGRRTFTAQAEPLADDEVAGLLADITRQNPSAIRMWERWAGPMDGSMENYLRAAPRFPSLRLKPEKDF